MKYTENYNLKKPEVKDFYNVDDMNENLDVLDGALKSNTDEIASVKSDLENLTAEDIGAVGTIKYVKDVDVLTLTEEGTYYVDNGTNTPIGDGKSGYVKVVPHPSTSGYCTIVWRTFNSNIEYVNVCVDGGWKGWTTGFLPLTGGELSGNELFLQDGKARIFSGDNVFRLDTYSEAKNDTNRRALWMANATKSDATNIHDAFRLLDVVNGTTKLYRIYGQHNITAGTTELTAGTSELADGCYYFQYE